MSIQVVGVGVGPSNLSLASLLQPRNISGQFLDKKKTFDWHSGLQLPDASLQVSFLKDLVTLADPTNPYSFLAYLHEHGRTYQFLNAQFEAITRQEFTQYLQWASEKNENIHFDEVVEDIEFDGDFVVSTSKRKLRAENISIGVGKTASVPDFVKDNLNDTMFHSSDYLFHAEDLSGKRLAIIGGGQSGAEIFLDLISREGSNAPEHISWISRRTGFWPLDDSPFTNDLFMPCHQEYFTSLGTKARQQFLKDNVLASDGISESTLREIYQCLYLRRFVRNSDNTADMFPNRTVEQVSKSGTRWMVQARHGDTGSPEFFDVDVVILSTGYTNSPLNFIGSIADKLHYSGDEVAVDDSFAARWNGPANRSIFIHNASREQKGLADPNLSLLAWRSAKMVDRITGTNNALEPNSSAVTWSPLEQTTSNQVLQTA